MMAMGLTPCHLPRRWPLETVADVEAVMEVLMQGQSSPRTLAAIWRAAALPWLMQHPRITVQQATYLLEVCDLGQEPCVVGCLHTQACQESDHAVEA